jgi:2-succinyl-5-enolpyruvyl-6-hydroxy-3-cyclohexene-1-carboxylate synthase
MPEDHELGEALSELAKDPSVAVIVEHTSNLTGPDFIHCTDRALNQLAKDELTAFQPDLVVVLGGAIVSKRIKTFLRTAKNLEAFRIGSDFPFMDTFQSLVFSSAVEPSSFVEYLLEINKQAKNASDFGERWKQRDRAAQQKHTAYLKSCPFSDLKAMKTVLGHIPGQSQVHIGNSSIIRYVLLFDPVKSIRYWCNRGTSGIDGSSSTACGAALGDTGSLHVLISGDMSFFYDSNAFWSNHKPANLRVIVLNNGGGDIFNIIPGPDTTPQRDRYFVARQHFSAEYICKAYGLEYASANSVETIDEQMKSLLLPAASGSPKLLEIHTAGIENSEVLKDYFKKNHKQNL